MMRLVNVICALLVLAAATWTYQVKHDAEKRLSQIRELEEQLDTNREMLDVLKADWAFLTQPARMQLLVQQFGEALGLDVTAAHQIVHFDELPDEPVFDASQGIEDIIVQEGLDNLPVGSIEGANQ